MKEQRKEIETCEHILRWGNASLGITTIFCGTRATQRYPAMGGGYAYLCDEHALPLLNHTEAVPGRSDD